MADIRKQIAEIVKQEGVFIGSTDAYYYPDIPEKVKVNAIKHLNAGIDSFAAAGDSSLFDNFNTGMVFSNAGIYHKDFLERSKFIGYIDFDHIYWETNPDFLHLISTKGTNMCIGDTDFDQKALLNALNRIKELAKTAGVTMPSEERTVYATATMASLFGGPIAAAVQQMALVDEEIRMRVQLQESNMDAATKQEVITKLNAEVVKLQMELRQEKQKSNQNSARINELSKQIDDMLDYIATLQQNAC